MRTLTTNKTRWAVLPAAALLLSTALAGCKGKEDDTAAPPSPAATTPTAGGPSTPA